MADRTTRFIVLGCGHTGTTLVSGLLHINGFGSFNVSRLFENLTLNDLNRAILSGKVSDDGPVRDFLAKVERRTRGKWALKDPQLTETIPMFYRNINHPVKIIFIFRDPGATVRSLRKEREMHEPHLNPDEMHEAAEQEYLTRTGAALAFLDTINQSPVLYVRYDDLVDGRSGDTLARFVGQSLDLSFVQPSKRHSSPIPVSDKVLNLHAELEKRYAENQREVIRTTNPVEQKMAEGMTLKTRIVVQSNRVTNRLRRLAQDVNRSFEEWRRF